MQMQEDTEKKTGGGNQAKKGEGRRDFEDRSLTSFPGLRLAFIPAGTKTASPALPALPLNPHQHALYHIHTHGREEYIRTHTQVQAFASLRKKKRKKGGAGGDRGGKWSISGQLSALLLNSGKIATCRLFNIYRSHKHFIGDNFLIEKVMSKSQLLM